MAVPLSIKSDRYSHTHLVRRFYFLVIALVLLSSTPLTCNGYWRFYVFDGYQLEVLKVIWGAWNETTPDLESNLAGWNISQPFPCSQQLSSPIPNWRGVVCLIDPDCVTNQTTGDVSCDTFITGLVLDNAHIGGILPPDIGNISTLTTLELTGNPNLTGNIPQSLKNTTLFVLDLHDNGFYGEIPNFGDSYRWPVTLDLSGNAFNGSFPLRQISSMVYLQKLNLARNKFVGPISPEGALKNMTQLEELDLSGNTFSGTPPDVTMIKNLQTLDFSSNRFTGTLPNLTTMHSLLTVNLSRNEFVGPFLLSSFFNMSASLTILDLSNNQLITDLNSWTLSEFGSLKELYLDNIYLINETLDISRISALGVVVMNSSSPLHVLSLMNNNISKVFYDVKKIENITTIRLQGNPFCDSPDSNDVTRCFCKQICFYSGASNKHTAVVIAVVVSTTSLLILIISLAGLFYRNRRYKRYLQLQVQQKFEELEVKPTIFPYSQLRAATRDFRPDMKLGEGAFGAVYKGILQNGSVVAVKQLFAKSTQGIDEFLNEVVLLTGMKHRNLVNLKGCCIREQEKLLVYEYVDNGDVDKVLLQVEGSDKSLVSWSVRLKICLGVARGLHYLHDLAHPRIIHRDIKASNVLLAKNYDTKIADFGLALLFPDEQSYIMTKHVAGTKGYMAPEYASFGQLSDKVDVFSFGVLCLEIVGGRRNIDGNYPPDEMYLSKWAWDLHRWNKLMDLVDPHMSLQDEEKREVHRLINIALLCIQNEAERRPSMERVVAMLQGEGEAEVVAPQLGNYEQYMRLGSLGTVTEDGLESSFMNSSRRGEGRSKDDYSTGGVLELGEIGVR